MMYVARCKMGKVRYGAIANTPMEQADCASDIKRLIKAGYSVTLEDPKSLDWCFEDKRTCKNCSVQKYPNECRTPNCGKPRQKHSDLCVGCEKELEGRN